MSTEELYTYLLTFFEGKSFENLILNKKNTEYKDIFEKQYREKIITEMNTEKYTKVMDKLSKSFLTNLVKGTNNKKFNNKDCNKILEIYHKLVENIANPDKDYERIALEHFTEVRNFINEFTNRKDEEIESSSYSPEFILKILDVKEDELKGKSLDVGCGKDGKLVEYLASKGVDASGIDMECEDIHTFIEGELTKRIGDDGKRLHTARSRNDQVAVDIKLYLRHEVEEIISLLKDLIKVIASKAKEYYDRAGKLAPDNYIVKGKHITGRN